MISVAELTVTAAGSAGTASGSYTLPVLCKGRLLGISLKYTGAPGTTVSTIKTVGEGVGFDETHLTITGNTNGRWRPRVPASNATGANRLYAAGGEPVTVEADFYGRFRLEVASSDPGAVISARIIYEDPR